MTKKFKTVLSATALATIVSAANLHSGNSAAVSAETKPSVSEANISASSKNAKTKDIKMAEIYEFKAKTLDGKELGLDHYKGKVLLIVNTASECGFTPQFKGLEALHKNYEPKGLEILGFPCNQFGGQEPGDAKEIGAFCQKNYGVTFQMFDKIDVNGKDAHPLYKYLTTAAPGALGTEGIKWNFTKFLVDKHGTVLKRYAPNTTPESIATDIEKQLAAQ